MRDQTSFYETLHQADADYSAGQYYLPSLFGSPAFTGWLREHQGADRAVCIADVGCGKGAFLASLAKELRSRKVGRDLEITGLDLVRSPGDHFAEISPAFEFIEHDASQTPLPLPDGSIDLLTCNHVLEHIFATEALLRDFRRLLAPGGLCIVSVPNLACWPNRVFGLFGVQPLGSELGLESITYGFRPGFLQRKLAPWKPSGHIRDFTPRGLEDLCRHCGLERVGWWSQSFGFLARLSSFAGRNIGILLKAAPTAPRNY